MFRIPPLFFSRDGAIKDQDRPFDYFDGII